MNQDCVNKHNWDPAGIRSKALKDYKKSCNNGIPVGADTDPNCLLSLSTKSVFCVRFR